MYTGNKPVVFFIMPFKEEMFALYEKLKSDFGNDFLFTNAGDLDSQRNILRDIVEGIHQADIVIADLTGLNANVFYELGLAHAMNKKVIIITQDLGEVPFDIKSYRAIDYSLLFYKIPEFLDQLKKMLFGAIDGSVRFGNPVSDYIPDFFDKSISSSIVSPATESTEIDEQVDPAESDEENGYLDYLADIIDNSNSINEEISAMGIDMQDMSQAINQASDEINRVKLQSGSADPSFVRSVCRKLAGPIEENAEKMKIHVSKIAIQWDIVENSYLSLLDNPLIRNEDNLEGIESSSSNLAGLRGTITGTDATIQSLISGLQTSVGVERRLTKAITKLIDELEAYLSMTNTMSSSIDRIIAKSDVIVSSIKNCDT